MDPLVRTQPKNNRPSGQVKVRAIPLVAPGEETPLEEPKTVKKPEKKCKRHPGKVIFCIIMAILLALLGAAGGIYFDRMVLLARDEGLAELNPTVEPDDVEQTLTAGEEADLSAKISYYTMTAWDGQPAEAISVRTDLDDAMLTAFLTNSLTEADKMTITVSSLSGEYEDTGLQETTKTYSLPADMVRAQYESLFGAEPTVTESYEICPGFAYDAVADVYYVGTGCGGTTLDWSLLYKESFNLENDVANAFIRAGSVVGAPETGMTLGVYNDYLGSDAKALYRGEDELGTSLADFSIDGTNFENFAQYRVTFVRNANGVFALDSVTRL